MDIVIANNSGDITVKINGRLDSTTVGELENALIALPDKDMRTLTIDMEKVDFVSSKGLRVLVSEYRKLAGRQMTIKGANESIREVFRLSGLLKVFNFA